MAEDTLNQLVLDSSVLIKWFCEEEGTSKALEIREQLLQGSVTIYCPDLAIYELANALRYNPALSPREVQHAVVSLFEVDIAIIVPTREVVESAIEVASTLDISVYDAYFVALAEELSAVCVTADKKLQRKAKNLTYLKLLEDV